MLFRSRKRNDGATALAERAASADDRSAEELFEEIERLEAANTDERDRERERMLIRLRHRAGIKLLADAGTQAGPAGAER